MRNLLFRPFNWCRERVSRESLVEKRLKECLDDIDREQLRKYNLWDEEFLVWDYRVRSIIRKYLALDHLKRYGRAIAAAGNNTGDALDDASGEIRAMIRSVRRTGVPQGTLGDAWPVQLLKLLVPCVSAAAAVIAAIAVPAIVVVVPQGDGPETQAVAHPPDPAADIVEGPGPVQEFVEDPGKAVTDVAAVSAPPKAFPEPSLDIPATPGQEDPSQASVLFFEAAVSILSHEDFAESELAQRAASDLLEHAVDEDPGFVRAYYNLGLAYHLAGKHEAAVADYSSAIDLWNSLDSMDSGLLFQAKLGRGLLLTEEGSSQQEICLGRADLLDYLNSAEVTARNEAIVEAALAGIDEDCDAAIGG